MGRLHGASDRRSGRAGESWALLKIMGTLVVVVLVVSRCLAVPGKRRFTGSRKTFWGGLAVLSAPSQRKDPALAAVAPPAAGGRTASAFLHRGASTPQKLGLGNDAVRPLGTWVYNASSVLDAVTSEVNCDRKIPAKPLSKHIRPLSIATSH